jgi:hypothetical protein
MRDGVVVGVIGGLLVHIAALYVVLGPVMETCTMGAADSLMIGPFLCIPLYVLGFTLLIISPLRIELWLGMSLALVGIACQVYWTLRFAISVGIFSVAACDVITGEGPYNLDGREAEFIGLWIGMSALAVTGAGWAWIRTRQRYRLSRVR